MINPDQQKIEAAFDGLFEQIMTIGRESNLELEGQAFSAEGNRYSEANPENLGWIILVKNGNRTINMRYEGKGEFCLAFDEANKIRINFLLGFWTPPNALFKYGHVVYSDADGSGGVLDCMRRSALLILETMEKLAEPLNDTRTSFAIRNLKESLYNIFY